MTQTKRTIWLVILLFITNICSFSANKLDWSSTKYKDIDEWIKFGKKHLRRTYRNGGVGPYAFDCSGFTMYMFKELGYALPHSSSAQADHGDKIKASNVKPGDLVFYAGSKGSSIGHVGIVIDVTDDDFSFIHASLKQGICIDKSTHSYYKPRYKTARRIYDMTADKSKKKENEESVVPAPIPQPLPQEEELELPGQTDHVDTDSNNDSVDNHKKKDTKKRESRRERRKREKAEKQRLEKEKEAKKKQEEARRKSNDSAKKEVEKETKKQTVKKEEPKETVKKKEKKDEKQAVVKKTHTVEKGETMYRISKMYGLTVDELKEINGLKTNDLSIGQVLTVEK